MDVHTPLPSSAPTDAGTLLLLAAARGNRLLICVGAGLSVSAGLPNGGDLGVRLDQRLKGSLQGYEPPTRPEDLLAVADAAEAVLEGPAALQEEVLELAPFDSALPNYAHEVTALLLAEGAITVLSWNWDTCIERAEERAGIRVACTEEQIAKVRDPQLLKVHGSADTPDSLLITTAQLDSPPKWADDSFRDRINTSETVFVGIGDIADYAQVRIEQLLERADRKAIRVVSPSILSGWDENQWSSVSPDLPLSHRVAKTADAFFDDLGRAWVGQLQRAIDVQAGELNGESRAGIDRLMSAFGELPAAPAIRWIRYATVNCRSGNGTVASSTSTSTALALSVLAKSASSVKFVAPARVAVDDRLLDVLIVSEPTRTVKLQKEALRRAQKLASDGSPEATYHFIVAGSILGSFEDADSMNVDVLAGDGSPDDVYDGTVHVETRFTDASTLLKELV